MHTAREITKALRGQWHGSYGMASCPVSGHGRGRGDKTPSLKIYDQIDGHVGVQCFVGCDWRDVKDELSRWGFLPTWTYANRHRDRSRRLQPPNSHCETPYINTHQTKKYAVEIWGVATDILGSLGKKYLRNRGITVDLPPTLRFHPSLKHHSGQHFPAIVACVEREPDRDLCAIQRTWLREDGSDKAPVEKSKMLLGDTKGGVVWMTPPRLTTMTGEGLETMLSCHQAKPDLGCCAALSTSFIPEIILPTVVKKLIVCVDADPAGRRAASKAARNFEPQGVKVLISDPGHGDFNDLLRAV